MTTIHIIANAINAKIASPDKNINLLLSNALSYEVEGVNFMPSAIKSQWSGISSFYKIKDATFPAGFVSHVRSVLLANGYMTKVLMKPIPPLLGDENPTIKGVSDDRRYDYQMEMVRILEKKKRMIAQIATGGGKTNCAILAYKRIKRMTLFITTRSVLMYQMKSRFEQQGEAVGIIGDNKLVIKKGFNVAMSQTLFSMLKDPERVDSVKALLGIIEFVILEEAHEISGDGYYEVLKHCKNAHYRLALTATPFMKDNGEDNMRLQAAVGGIGIKISEKQLIDCGILAKPYFKFVSTEKPVGIVRSSSWIRAYKLGIVQNKPRNTAIIYEANRAVKYGLKVIILVIRREHGEILLKLLKKEKIKSKFINGSSSKEQREHALHTLSTGKIDVLIGSTIADVGIDVPAIGMVILAGGCKAEVNLRQRIGRGLRAKKEAGNVTFVVDFNDEHNRITQSHAKQRQAIIESTDGFREGILKPDQDFDFKLTKI